jgi:hypothetical protein
MEIRAHPILFATMPLRAISGVSSRMRREDQFSLSSLSLGRLPLNHACAAQHPIFRIHARPARSIFSNALNFRCSAFAALVCSHAITLASTEFVL